MKKLLVVCLSGLLMFAGCSKKEEVKQTVCKGELNGVHVTSTIDAEGDNVLKQVNTNEISYEALGVTKADIEALAKEAETAYAGIKGVTYTYTVGELSTTETTTIDYTVATIQELMDAGIVYESDEKVDYISLEATIKATEGTGVTCK